MFSQSNCSSVKSGIEVQIKVNPIKDWYSKDFFPLIHFHFSSFIIMFGCLALVSVDLKNDLEACLVNGFWFDLSLHNRSKPGALQESYKLIYTNQHPALWSRHKTQRCQNIWEWFSYMLDHTSNLGVVLDKQLSFSLCFANVTQASMNLCVANPWIVFNFPKFFHIMSFVPSLGFL